MSVSPISSSKASVAALIDIENRDFAQAQARHALLTGLLQHLPEGSPAPKQVFNSAYCGKATVIFDGAELAQQLLALYPPQPLLDVSGSTRTQKPARWLRDEDQRSAQAELFPVLEKSDHRGRHLHWWTCMALDPADPSHTLDVAIEVRNAGLGALAIPAGVYQPDSFSYATGTCSFQVRMLRDIPGAPCALGRWQAAWEAFLDEQGYSALQLQFARAIHTISVRQGRAMTMAELPEPHYATPGMALAIGPGRELPAQVEEALQRQRARQAHALDRTGDFWAAFAHSREEVEKLLTFLAGHFAREAEAKAAFEEEVAQVKAWLVQYMAAYPGAVAPSYSRAIAARVEQACRRATGLAVTLHFSPRERGELHIGLKFDGDRMHHHLTVQCRDWQNTALLPQHLPCEYVPLPGDGHFVE